MYFRISLSILTFGLIFYYLYESSEDINPKGIKFPVKYRNGVKDLQGFLYRSEKDSPIPVVFTSGFTGGSSMYGQLFGKSLSGRKGFDVMTYDVAGFYTNKQVLNHDYHHDGVQITNVNLKDQEDELRGAIDWMRKMYGRFPVVVSWAMGSIVNLGTVIGMSGSLPHSIPLTVILSYTKMKNLQNLRKDKDFSDSEIRKLDGMSPIPVFDLGTEDTITGFYPLDKKTQDYVHDQLGNYTREGGVDNWPGIEYVTAQSYSNSLDYDPEILLQGMENLPKMLIIHGEKNTLHMPQESIRLAEVYPGEVINGKAMIIKNMRHGQELRLGNPIFEEVLDLIESCIISL